MGVTELIPFKIGGRPRTTDIIGFKRHLLHFASSMCVVLLCMIFRDGKRFIIIGGNGAFPVCGKVNSVFRQRYENRLTKSEPSAAVIDSQTVKKQPTRRSAWLMAAREYQVGSGIY